MTFLYCNGCKSIICYPAFYLKHAVACTTEYRMIYKGQGKKAPIMSERKPISDERGHNINDVTGTWHSTIGYVRMGRVDSQYVQYRADASSK